MLNVGSISSHKKQFINEASILRLRPYVIDEIGEDESFYLYQQCHYGDSQKAEQGRDEHAICGKLSLAVMKLSHIKYDRSARHR